MTTLPQSGEQQCSGPWLGLAGQWMGSLDFVHGFSFFFVFYLIYQGEHFNHISND
jgi:hypothetical protein